MTAKKKGTAVANWEQEMAEQAQTAVETENTAASGGGRFFSMRGGILSFDDTALPGNQMAVVILDSIFETLYYEGSFDADNPQTPVAFALGRNAEELVWNEEYSDPEFAGKLCSESEVCEWGSAETGRGKAAKETRRLAIIPAGTYAKNGDLELEDDPAFFKSADIAYMKLPVMSVKGFSTYLKSVAEQLNRPLHGVITRIYLEPDPKSQFRVRFELIEALESDLIPTIMERHKEAVQEIDFPYIPREEDEQQTQKKASTTKKLRGGKAAGSRARKK